MPDIVNAFPLSIYRSPLTIDPLIRARMVETVLEMSRTRPRKSEGSSWTGDVNGFGFLHQDPRFVDLFAAFPEHLNQYLRFLKLDPDQLHLYYTRSWATIAQGQERINPHRHRQSHISVVYYLSKPEQSGGIAFFDPEAPNQFAPHLFREETLRHGIVKEPAIFNTQAVNLEPKEGEVLIFPSMTQHATEPNLSDKPRMSIAVDIVTTVKESGLLEFMLPDLDKWTLAF